jgi:NADPH:quinone reductase-like Zn-dependent oxidoreductase
MIASNCPAFPAAVPIVLKPASLSFEGAAAIPYGAGLALFFLKQANLQDGQKVLIYGASGAIGTAAVQLARYFGTTVTGVCSSTNLESKAWSNALSNWETGLSLSL